MSYNFSNFESKLTSAVDHLKQDLSSLRTGKASAQLLDPIMIEVYGSKMKIQELASVNVPDPTMIVITPWDKNILEDLSKGIMAAQLNLNPIIDGEMIRISIPPLTEERRKEMVKLLSQKIEAGKVMMRNIRQDVKKEIESQKGQDGVSEDDVKLDLDVLEDKYKEALSEVDTIAQQKEKELMTV